MMLLLIFSTNSALVSSKITFAAFVLLDQHYSLFRACAYCRVDFVILEQ